MDISEEMLHQGMRHTCYGCNNVWGECTCGYAEPDEGLGFYYDGFFISNPYVSENEMWMVDPVVYYGKAYVEWVGSDNHRRWLEACEVSKTMKVEEK